MSMKRIVTEAQAEVNTWRRAKDDSELMVSGPEKTKTQMVVDDMKSRVNARIANNRSKHNG